MIIHEINACTVNMTAERHSQPSKFAGVGALSQHSSEEFFSFKDRSCWKPLQQDAMTAIIYLHLQFNF